VVGAIVLLVVRSKNRARRDGSPAPLPGFAPYAQQQPYGNQGLPPNPYQQQPTPPPAPPNQPPPDGGNPYQR
jgi:hypothetical protein